MTDLIETIITELKQRRDWNNPQEVETWFEEKLREVEAQARAEERASLRHDMIVKMHGWHGTGLAMINDYFKRLTKKD